MRLEARLLVFREPPLLAFPCLDEALVVLKDDDEDEDEDEEEEAMSGVAAPPSSTEPSPPTESWSVAGTRRCLARCCFCLCFLAMTCRSRDRARASLLASECIWNERPLKAASLSSTIGVPPSSPHVMIGDVSFSSSSLFGEPGPTAADMGMGLGVIATSSWLSKPA